MGQEVLKFLDWSYHHGGGMAEQLHYVPMPDKVVKLIQANWQKEIKDATGKAIWSASPAPNW